MPGKPRGKPFSKGDDARRLDPTVASHARFPERYGAKEVLVDDGTEAGPDLRCERCKRIYPNIRRSCHGCRECPAAPAVIDTSDLRCDLCKRIYPGCVQSIRGCSKCPKNPSS
jgi:hypothetical protein